MSHRIALNDGPHINLYGCGGTGSHVLLGLARLNKAITDLGASPFHVNVYDPDTVEERNVGRQAFSHTEVGINKAHALVDRINLHYGLGWYGYDKKAPASSDAEIIVSCVDTGQSRKEISDSIIKYNPYMIDCGNSRYQGQVILGQYNGELPNPYKENPELLVSDNDEEQPPCTDPFYAQDLFINQIIATYALHYVWFLFRKDEIDTRGVFVDIEQGVTNPITI